MLLYSSCIVHLTENVHRLRDISNLVVEEPDSRAVEIQQLCVDAADDIKRCANTCDTYLKFVLVAPFYPSLTKIVQEEATCQNLRWVNVGRQALGVR